MQQPPSAPPSSHGPRQRGCGPSGERRRVDPVCTWAAPASCDPSSRVLALALRRHRIERTTADQGANMSCSVRSVAVKMGGRSAPSRLTNRARSSVRHVPAGRQNLPGPPGSISPASAAPTHWGQLWGQVAAKSARCTREVRFLSGGQSRNARVLRGEAGPARNRTRMSTAKW